MLVLLAACNFRTNPLGADGSDFCQVAPDCDDHVECTNDQLDTATCTCTHTEITALVSGDGCCPSGGTYATDHDCSATCGNGIVEGNEMCDTGIASGSGACPTSCDDSMACTTDTLVSGGTCDATCSHTTVTQAVNGDGCCPSGATGLTDDDCPAAYRITSLTLRDPHVFIDFMGCKDFTSLADSTEQYQMQHDSNNDGYLDDSQVIVFRPLSQTGGTQTPAEVYYQAKCTATATTCKPGNIASAALTASNLATGTCLTPLAGTTKPYTPAVTDATGPCFSTGATNLTGEVLGTAVTVEDAQVAGTYMGTPATDVINGLYAAFISQTDAQGHNAQVGLANQSIASYFPGGNNNCSNSSDKDTLASSATQGWWVYYNFTATAVPWTDQ